METADTLTTHLKHERTQARERSPAQSCRAGDKTWYPGRTSQAALHTCEASSACLQRNPGEDGLTEGRTHRHLTANSPPEQSLRPAFLTGRVRPHRSAVFRSTASTWPFAGCCIATTFSAVVLSLSPPSSHQLRRAPAFFTTSKPKRYQGELWDSGVKCLGGVGIQRHLGDLLSNVFGSKFNSHLFSH